MLIPSVAMYILIGVFAAMGLYFASQAETAGARSGLYKGLAAVGFVGGAIVLVTWLAFTSTTYIFEGKAPHISHAKYYLLGGKSIALKASRKQAEIANGAGTWIVNDTDVPFTLTTAQYSSFSFGGGGPDNVEIPPGTAAISKDGLDHIGPDDPLPESVSSKASSATRVRVSW